MKLIFFFLLIIGCSQINGQIINTVVGNGMEGVGGDGGQATAAELYSPQSVAIDVIGNIYIADRNNNRIQKVNTAGIITTVAGNGTLGFSGDGGQATNAELNNPYAVTADTKGNLYIADGQNNRIRKVDTSGIINTVVGNGTQGYSGDGGQATAAELYYPWDIALDGFGNMYIADEGNNCIRKVNPSGIISTIAGTGTLGNSGDGGQATDASLYFPEGVTVDGSGNIYIADSYNDVIRKIDTSGIISTIAGNGAIGFSGDNGPATAAKLYRPTRVAVDAVGNICFSDYYNNRIRKIDTLGIITTIAGTSVAGFSGDGGQANAADLYLPNGVAFDAIGNLYIADEVNDRIRKISNVANGIEQVSMNNEQINIYPNPTSTIINIVLKQIQNNNTEIKITNVLGEEIKEVRNKIQETRVEIDVSNLQSGIYFVCVKTAEGIFAKKIIIQH